MKCCSSAGSRRLCWAALVCDSALSQGKPEGRHLNTDSGAEFDSSALEQTLVPKRQAGPTLLLVWGWDTGEMLGTESQILLGFN